MSVNPWAMGRSGWRDSHPLGWDAEQFILDNCQYMLYVRKDLRFKCVDHWDLASSAEKYSNQYCATCWGFGMKVDPLIIPARLSQYEANVTPRRSDVRQDLGYMEFADAIMHTPRAVMPKLEDLTMVCEWDTQAQDLGAVRRPRPLRITSIFRVKSVADRFERELSWYSCGLETNEADRQRLERALPLMQDLEVLDTSDSWALKSNWW